MAYEQSEPLHKWTPIEDHEHGIRRTFRMRVPGGWLYRFRERQGGGPMPDSMVFVPNVSEAE